jgi:hypothetical protein
MPITIQLFDVTFRVVTPGLEGSSRAYHYCREPRRELVVADCAQDVLRVLEAHVPLQAGELIEIIGARDAGTALT